MQMTSLIFTSSNKGSSGDDGGGGSSGNSEHVWFRDFGLIKS